MNFGGQKISAPGGVPTGGLDTLAKAVSTGFSIFLLVAVILSLAFLVMGGIQWSMSGGDKNKVVAARGKITWAIIGLVISLSTFFIINLVGYFFGVNLLKISK